MKEKIITSLSQIRSSRSAEEYFKGNSRLFELISLDEVELRLRSRFTKLVCKQMDHLRSLGDLPLVPSTSISIFKKVSDVPTTRHEKSLSATQKTRKEEITGTSIKENLEELLEYLGKYEKEVTHIDQTQNNCAKLESILTESLSGIKKILMHTLCKGSDSEKSGCGLTNHEVHIIDSLQRVVNWSNCLEKKPIFTTELEQVVSMIIGSETTASYETTVHTANLKNKDYGEPLSITDYGAYLKNIDQRKTHLKNTNQRAHSRNRDKGAHPKNTNLVPHQKNTHQGAHQKNTNQDANLKHVDHGTQSKHTHLRAHSKNTDQGTKLKISDHIGHSENRDQKLDKTVGNQSISKPINNHEKRISGYINKRYKRNINWNSKHKTGRRWFDLSNEQEQKIDNWKNENRYREQHSLSTGKLKTDEQTKNAQNDRSIFNGSELKTKVKNKNKTDGLYRQYETDPRTVFKRTQPENRTWAIEKKIQRKKGEWSTYHDITEKNKENASQEIRGTRAFGKVSENNKPENDLEAVQIVRDKIQSGITSKPKKEMDESEKKSKPRFEAASTQEKIEKKTMSETENEKVENSKGNTGKTIKFTTDEVEDEGTQKVINSTTEKNQMKKQLINLDREEETKNTPEFKIQTDSISQISHVKSEKENTKSYIKICASKSDTAIIKRKGYKAGNLQQKCKAKALAQPIATEQRTANKFCNITDVIFSFRTFIRVMLFMFLSYLIIDMICLNSVSTPVIAEISKYLDLRHVHSKPF